MANNMTVTVSTLEEFNKRIAEYQSKIDELREDGVKKIKQIQFDTRNIKISKKIEKSEKARLIEENNAKLIEANGIKEQNADEIKSISTEACEFARVNYKQFYIETKNKAKAEKEAAKSLFASKKLEIESEFNGKINKLKEEEIEKLSSIDKASDKEEYNKVKKYYQRKIDNAKQGKQQNIFEAKSQLDKSIQKSKDDLHNCYIYLDDIINNIKDGRRNPIEQTQNKIEKYLYRFKLSDFLMKNGLFIIILIFIIACVCYKPNLLDLNHVLLILKNFSTKVFFALGVAGLILLGGTDLSIGRIITATTMFTCAILNPNTSVTFFGLSTNAIYANLGLGGAVVVALLISLLFSVGFSMLAGYLTSKFKIHPFISTLGTSLIIWGLIAVATKNEKTGAISDEASLIAQNLGSSQFSIVIFYALIAIAIVWFIWNKTKFGKNMYAVGGNQEAASVSGINVFWVTMGVFIMAGVLYGFGGFIQSTVTGSSSTGFGQGWELEAIAACVIGGISFTGGIGKISGAVFGCLLFETMKALLRGVFNNNSDVANIFIGAIILLAVTFDSLKYLKKK